MAWKEESKQRKCWYSHPLKTGQRQKHKDRMFLERLTHSTEVAYYLTICMSCRTLSLDDIVRIFISSNHLFYVGAKSVIHICEQGPAGNGYISVTPCSPNTATNLDTARWQSPKNGLICDEGIVKSVFRFTAIKCRNPTATMASSAVTAAAAAHYDGGGGSRAFALLSQEVYNWRNYWFSFNALSTTEGWLLEHWKTVRSSKQTITKQGRAWKIPLDGRRRGRECVQISY